MEKLSYFYLLFFLSTLFLSFVRTGILLVVVWALNCMEERESYSSV